MTKKYRHPRPQAAGGAAEARRWLQRCREIGEAPARAEYHQEERRKERKDRGGYDWWRTNVHRPLHEAPHN